MRRVLVALVAILTLLAPLATANQAPVPLASVQSTAVLNEPVVFTSLSYDQIGRAHV